MSNAEIITGLLPSNSQGDFCTRGEYVIDSVSSEILTAWHSSCLDCGGPQRVAPELVSKLGDPEGTYFIRQPETKDEVYAACVAIRSCCNDSLVYRGTNRLITQMLKDEAETG